MMAAVNTGKWYKPKKDFQPAEPRAEIQRENTIEGRIQQSIENTKGDELYGFHQVTDSKERTGFLINMHSADIVDEDKRVISGSNFYFLEENCTRFKIFMPYYPYFYILCKKDTIEDVSNFLMKKYVGLIAKLQPVLKEDLDLPNHLIGLKQKYLKLYFINTIHMMRVKKDMMQTVRINKGRESGNKYYNELVANLYNKNNYKYDNKYNKDHMENIIDIREHDVPHHVRVSIDLGICVGTWYSVKSQGTHPPIITKLKEMIVPPEPIVLAYDIETTKQPLKFPDSNTDQIMMISYMIDGQGYLITNREIISSDIDDFEYTPKPEFEGIFKVFNEPNEKATINRFFNHINDIKPHIFVSYNGDFFDWPFVENRAAIHGIDMKERIGFSKNKEDIYTSRAAIHMDCLNWVKRDSYLPVGSQGLKAVAKAKLRYNPIELDAEDMCRFAVEDPEVLANYSVSDAVATYYLYNKYVHPFIFALCTIIPMEPDEVLRKGSGTLCETLLMVEAFRANIIFPNKQEAQLNKMKDGHLIESETYVGGHVEALESGVFRADIPYRFKIIPSAVDKLISGVEDALKHAIVKEEKIPMDAVLNYDEICEEIKNKLLALKNQPLRLENPAIYHLDVGAMYPNIILTNRLQPSAIVDETVCAACDYNRPNAKCKRVMEWQWRGEVLTANMSENQNVQQQLEREKFPSAFPNGPRRAFHQLSKVDQAQHLKTRLSQYCKKAYKKVKKTVLEVRQQTVCQRENSFYVDTVRAFRDRRYEYKGMTKVAKQEVASAIARNDAAEIKIAKSKEVLYDSLQLAHKCILNSFYGYVMRKGSRWFSMEMGGIVCHTGANIIMKAREIIEDVGRPLELDTDGIWCMLPASFPNNVVLKTTLPKKSQVTLSYPNAVLNFMVKENFTNDVYHELVDPENLVYEVRSENTIFFEVDGPYLAMVLPAAKEEGKKLKKRYAVFNFDGSLAELKGFEVKRRGELQLIKLFQSSVFESFLKGHTLEECYSAVAAVANHWLDILFTKGGNLSDAELFELISENKSLSKQLDDYGEQRSTSISTAKRLAEFLGDQMVKDKGLACKYVITSWPLDAPVSERAIPLAIFQSDPHITKHYLRKWLKKPTLDDFDIRSILDWNYYIERLGSAIQKIITIPAAMQGISNPVPRIQHPEWLHKKLMEKSDKNRQKKINDIFKTDHVVKTNYNDTADSAEIVDIEDAAGTSGMSSSKVPITTYNKRKIDDVDDTDNTSLKTWKEVLGNPPPMGNSEAEFRKWFEFHRKKWEFLWEQKGVTHKSKRSKKGKGPVRLNPVNSSVNRQIPRVANTTTLAGFFRQAQRKLLQMPWRIIQLAPTNELGFFKAWILVDRELQQVRLEIPRIFYVNMRKEREVKEDSCYVKCPGKVLPRSRPIYYLYKYTCTEDKFQKHNHSLVDDLNTPDVEGIYETQVTLEFRAILTLGCVCRVRKDYTSVNTDTFHMDNLEYKSSHSIGGYLKEDGLLKYIFFYQHWSSNHQRSVWGMFLSPIKKAYICIQDSVRTEKQIPNINNSYTNERNLALEQDYKEFVKKTPEEFQFDVQVMTSFKNVIRVFQNALKSYKQDMKGATAIIFQTAMEKSQLISEMPQLNDFPVIETHIKDLENLYTSLEWQKIGVSKMLRHYFLSDHIIQIMIDQSNFFHVPVGNVPTDAPIFGADLLYARLLVQNNFVLWCSPTEKPDFGGSENDDNRLLTDFEESSSCIINNSGTYSTVSVEIEIDSLAVNTLLQSSHVHDVDGITSSIAFLHKPQLSLQEMISDDKNKFCLPFYDETALCSSAYKILKSTVTDWVQKVSQHGNIFADMLIINFHRWIRNPNSLLYDPALRRTLHNDMKKLFIQLVSEFQNFGAIIVHANFNKIIICTKKRGVQDGLDNTEFIIQSIQNKELFHSINMNSKKCWEYLIWLDMANYAGVKGKLSEDQENETIDEDDEEEMSNIEMNWNLIEYLPSEGRCQQCFNTVISTFIFHVNNHIHEIEPGNNTPRPRKRRDSSASQYQLTPQMGVGSLEDAANYAKHLVSNEISRKLFEVIVKIHKKVPSKTLTEDECTRMGVDYSSKKKIIPALELVKAICKVLSLDPAIEEEVHRLKSNLCRLIGIGQFSDEAQWKDPCLSFILPEIVCQECFHIRDIDLCKDKNRDEENGRLCWKCPLCFAKYNNDEIEFNLIDVLNRKIMGYTLQDLQCLNCGEIQMDNMSKYCTCSGCYRTVVSKDEIKNFMRIIKYLAIKGEMHILNEMLDNTGYVNV